MKHSVKKFHIIVIPYLIILNEVEFLNNFIGKITMNILYTASNEHIPNYDHYEIPKRINVVMDYILTTEPYKSLIMNPTTRENTEIIELITKVQGSDILKTFIRPDEDIFCSDCDNLYDNSDTCPKCKSKNNMWMVIGDTYVTSKSASAVKECIEIMMTSLDNIKGGSKYQYLLTRPPGHHSSDKSSGFCLVNNVFILSEYAIRRGFKRVAILDTDYHYFNGTAALAVGKSDRFLISMHAFGTNIYPFCGSKKENTNNVKNFPLLINEPSDKFKYTDSYCLSIMENKIIPLLENWSPDLILISNGFDADRRDPLAGLNLTKEFYVETCKMLKTFNVPLIYVLEGGYNPNVIKDNSIAIIDELLI